MSRIVTIVFALLIIGSLTTVLPAEESKKKSKPAATQGTPADLNELSLEVSVLQTLHHLQLTKDQLQILAVLAPKTAAMPGQRKDAKGSASIRTTLTALRKALIEADDERIDKLNEELADRIVKEMTEFDDTIEATEAAQREAPKLLRRLSPRQVGRFFVANADELPDPLEQLLKAVEKAQKAKGDDWRDLRDNVPEAVARLLSGSDTEKAGKISDRVFDLLQQAHEMTGAEFTKKSPELEKTAKAIAESTGPVDVLSHVMEAALADVLSNPRLANAVALLLKQPDKPKVDEGDIKKDKPTPPKPQ